MTDWYANGISIASLGTTIVLGVLQLRKGGERRAAPPEWPDDPGGPLPEVPPAGGGRPFPRGGAAFPPDRPPPGHGPFPFPPSPPEPPGPDSAPSPPPPPPRSPRWPASPRRAFRYAMSTTAVAVALFQFLSISPAVQSAVAIGLLAAVLAVWPARRSRGGTSDRLTGLLLLLVGLASSMAVLAVPLDPILRLPQVVVALIVPWFLLSRLTDRGPAWPPDERD
ncbi:hypothetical protein amrb99_03590 [Actinomadura sp. RB99]|uniref:hypothetical protein n=1 Tax=Actinomadura sp. RB99 TaxID=2691577 RepID=UPI001687FA05|nr:hypothetical protein [Actinomadura sp. RB99]MBD2891453.1 hypothetical protein [Actinomadura sp. RB99]